MFVELYLYIYSWFFKKEETVINDEYIFVTIDV